MEMEYIPHSKYGLENHGIRNVRNVFWNIPRPTLVEEAIRRREGHLAHFGPLVVRTGQHTGRSAKDKFIVQEPSSQDKVWWGDVNNSMDQEHFNSLHHRLLAYWQGKDLFVQDCFAGADPNHRMPVRIVTETAWHSVFARNMFIPSRLDLLESHIPEFTVLHAPYFHAIPSFDKTRSEVFVVINFGEKLVLIGGSQYAGEIKKSIFTILNYVLPQQNVLSMHCSANMDSTEKVALFFGLSGTGKTTLSTDSSRVLIGDDEHGWSEGGIFNIEGGCYAKVIKLSEEDEPEIYQTTRQFGTVLENVGFNNVTDQIDLNDDSLTENTRAAYPISHIPSASETGVGSHPSNIIMLTADAFGVLPPIAKLSPEQAMYHFLSGYTAKVAGTEKGVTEPQATFSACFGAPFMALSPIIYANMLKEKIKKHNVNVWLINTGWNGGPYGVGKRIKIAYTRAMVRAAIDGKLQNVQMTNFPKFDLSVPTSCPDVPSEVLNPRNTWNDKAAYDEQTNKLANMFAENFKYFEKDVPEEVRTAGPILN
jgi:phosphoenolpyruvate carboxykinase (ATP)